MIQGTVSGHRYKRKAANSHLIAGWIIVFFQGTSILATAYLSNNYSSFITPG